MNILVIDQCSNAKTYPDHATVFDAEQIDTHSLEELQTQSGTVTRKANNLYAGRQQQYISQAIEKLETKSDDTVDRHFISAGFGVVAADEHLPPYDVTFTDYSTAEIHERAEKLGIQNDILRILNGAYDLIFFALGSDYYQTFDLETVLETIPRDTWVVCFNHDQVTSAFDNVLSLPARTPQAKEQETIVVALKGRYLQNFADHRAAGKEIATLADVKRYCLEKYTNQTGLEEYEE